MAEYRLGIDDEPIAHAHFRQDIPRTAGVDFEFAPQAADIDPQRAGIVASWPPNFLDQRARSHDAFAMAGESLQYPMFERGQAHLAPIPTAGDTPAPIDGGIAEH